MDNVRAPRTAARRSGRLQALPPVTDDGVLEPQVVKSAERSVRLLETLAAAPGRQTLPELQAATGIPKSSLHVLLRTLLRAGWVEQGASGDGFGIGPRALICGTAYLDRDPALKLGIEAIESLRAEVGYTTHYGRLDGPNVLYLAKREATSPARTASREGRCLPAHLTALGLVLLADRTDEEVTAVLPRDLTPLTSESVTDRAELLAVIDDVRRSGVAVERQQNTMGTCCVARAVAYRIPATDSISCSMPVSMATKRELTRVSDALVRHADRLALSLRRAGVR